jgi:hypothetical protein
MIRRSAPGIIFATRSGGTTIDRDAFGGNPFATSLIQLIEAQPVSLRRFPYRLRAMTAEASRRHQTPQWTAWPSQANWTFQLRPDSRQERRCALVLVVSNYARAGLAPLAGAAHDERRISAMLRANGFSVRRSVKPARAALVRALADFRRWSRDHDAALIYCTGHGVEWNGSVHLLPGDYPIADGCAPTRLRTRAIAVDRIAAACRATKLNLVFFAGCRTRVSKTTVTSDARPTTGAKGRGRRG